MPISLKFQKRIRELVVDTDLNNSELIKLMDIDSRPFSHAINYGIIPSTRTLVRIADYFQVSLSYLLGTTNEEIFYPAEPKADFSSRLKQLCGEANLTPYGLAIECHLDKSCVSRWLRLKTLPTLEFLELIADYFSVSLDYLLGRTDERD